VAVHFFEKEIPLKKACYMSMLQSSVAVENGWLHDVSICFS
jgi:hypothetical protein